MAKQYNHWRYETHELPGRTVTIVEVQVPKRGRGAVGKWHLVKGVSIRNPKDCPLKNDGIKFALARALDRGKVGKVRRTKIWADFLQKFPPVTGVRK